MEENKQLEDMARKLKNERSKAWARKNKDKIKEINKRYWLKKAKEKLAEEKKRGGIDDGRSVKCKRINSISPL